MPRYGRKRQRFMRGPTGDMRMSVRLRRALVPMEKKYLDTSIGAPLTHTCGTPSYILLNGMGQNTTASTRIGNKIMIDSVSCKMLVTASGGADIDPGASTGIFDLNYRVVLLVDKQALGSAPTFTQIFGADAIQQHRSLDATTRFRILYDKVHHFRMGDGVYTGTAGAVDLPGRSKLLRINYKFKKPLVTHYNGVAGTVADIKANSLYLVILGASGSDLDTILFNGKARIRFTDA